MRVRLEFEEALSSQRIWYPVTKRQRSSSIKDFANNIIRDFELEEKCPNGIILEIEDFGLLHTFNVGDLIRDNDLIRHVVNKTTRIEKKTAYFLPFCIRRQKCSEDSDASSGKNDNLRMIQNHIPSSNESDREETEKKVSSSSSSSTSDENEDIEKENGIGEKSDGSDSSDEFDKKCSRENLEAEGAADELICKTTDGKNEATSEQESMKEQQQKKVTVSKSKARNQRRRAARKRINLLISNNVGTLNDENGLNNNDKQSVIDISQQQNEESNIIRSQSLLELGVSLKPPMSLFSTSNKRKGYFQEMKNKTPIHLRFTYDEEKKEVEGQDSNENTSSQHRVNATSNAKVIGEKQVDKNGNINLELVSEEIYPQLPSPRAIITRVDITRTQQNGDRQQKRSMKLPINKYAKKQDESFNGDDRNDSFYFDQVEGHVTDEDSNVQGREVLSDSKSYESMELYRGQPRIDDVIVYRVLEFSRSSFTPEFSAYEKAKIIGYNPLTNDVTLERCDVKSGDQPIYSVMNDKFYIEGLEDEYIIDNGQEPRIGVFTIKWDRLEHVKVFSEK
ncbi:8094_t:CDS:2 [Acaulospora morrowiae]|uniref:8094_t:CDS:1 n=1 Tax=Acaulospora morrowiae TaxID=94023 RepID=A0A9N8YYR5_9GLOM|nr:8094_t:CDS:2 [Acaulospora morrowiae]